MEEAFVSTGALNMFRYRLIKDSSETVKYSNSSLLRNPVPLTVIVKPTFGFLAVPMSLPFPLQRQNLRAHPHPMQTGFSEGRNGVGKILYSTVVVF